MPTQHNNSMTYYTINQQDTELLNTSNEFKNQIKNHLICKFDSIFNEAITNLMNKMRY